VVRRAKSSVSSACAASLRNRYKPTLLSFRNVMHDFGFWSAVTRRRFLDGRVARKTIQKL
jgi:hypothetical protein